jgi:6,7-dimethyl-8-ribityllumazine synthase
LSTDGSHVEQARGSFDASARKIALLVSRFNADITERLLEGALACLTEHGAARSDIDVVHVPGAWELPQTAARVVELGRHDGIVALGCVIRGETPHFDYVCSQASAGLGAVARSAPMPVLFGVLTTDDHAQALARAGDGKDNKGYECAIAALEMIDVFNAVEGS